MSVPNASRPTLLTVAFALACCPRSSGLGAMTRAGVLRYRSLGVQPNVTLREAAAGAISIGTALAIQYGEMTSKLYYICSCFGLAIVKACAFELETH